MVGTRGWIGGERAGKSRLRRAERAANVLSMADHFWI